MIVALYHWSDFARLKLFGGCRIEESGPLKQTSPTTDKT